MKRDILTVSGLQWGDEGKGRVCHDLARDADIVVRTQGGANAGHTIYSKGKKFVFHLLPCGVLNPEKINVLGPAVFVDPVRLAQELRNLREAGLNPDSDRVLIDAHAPLVTPWHKAIDSGTGGKIGTTGQGIGPMASDFYSRSALSLHRVMTDPESIQNAYLEYKKIAKCHGYPEVSQRQVTDFRKAVETLLPLAKDTVLFLQSESTANKKILIEGAQGALLDILFGTYPFVTSSFTGAAALPWLAGLGKSTRTFNIGVSKAYTTRVGNGPFPTEDTTNAGDALRSMGEEYGSTTGRPRRCGWLDLPALQYVCQVTGIDALVLTKLDVLSTLGNFKVAVAYRDQDENIVPWTRGLPGTIRPEYTEMTAGAPEPEALWVKDLIRLVEKHVKIPVIGVTMGKSTADARYFNDPWAE